MPSLISPESQIIRAKSLVTLATESVRLEVILGTESVCLEITLANESVCLGHGMMSVPVHMSF